MNIIFDFDGTIADSFETVIGIFHELTHRDATLHPKEIKRLRGMSLLHAAEELDVKPWKMPFLLIRGRRRMSKRMNDIEAYPGVPETIQKMHAEGDDLYIMSSNSVQNIQSFLERHTMNTEFIKIYGSVGLFSKARVLKKVVRQNRLDPSQTWYVGDEVRDIEAAQHARLKIMAVAWGYNDRGILKQHNPTCLLTSPDQMMQARHEKI